MQKSRKKEIRKKLVCRYILRKLPRQDINRLFYHVLENLASRFDLIDNSRDLPGEPAVGCAHLAVSAGSVEAVDALTARLRADGYQVVGGPRYTGDGYYESVVLDPDGNRVEITI